MTQPAAVGLKIPITFSI